MYRECGMNGTKCCLQIIENWEYHPVWTRTWFPMSTTNDQCLVGSCERSVSWSQTLLHLAPGHRTIFYLWYCNRGIWKLVNKAEHKRLNCFEEKKSCRCPIACLEHCHSVFPLGRQQTQHADYFSFIKRFIYWTV